MTRRLGGVARHGVRGMAVGVSVAVSRIAGGLGGIARHGVGRIADGMTIAVGGVVWLSGVARVHGVLSRFAGCAVC